MNRKIKYSLLCLAIVFAFASCIIGLMTVRRMYSNLNRRIDTLITQGDSSLYGYVDGEYIELDMNDRTREIEVNSLNSEWEIPVEFVFSDSYKVYFDNIEVISNKVFFYKVNAISESDKIDITVVNNATKKEVTYSLLTLPKNIGKFQTVGKSPLKGDYYTTTVNGYGTLYKIDATGTIKYYKFSPEKRFSDFKKVETRDGDVRYIYGEEYKSTLTLNAATTPVEWVVLDAQYHEINRIGIKKTKKIQVDKFPADQHDILYLDDKNYYLLAYVGKSVQNVPEDVEGIKNGDRLIATVIQGFKNGKCFFEWDSTDYPELYRMSVEGSDYARFADYAHANSLDIDKSDGNLIVSFRNLDAICKISTKNGDILWTLGGKEDSFKLDETQKTSRQHFARYNDNGSITVYDNGNVSRESRVCEYWIDEDNLELIKFNEYKWGGYYSMATGSAQRLKNDENIFVIGWGMKDENSKGLDQPSISEINFDTGEVYFELFFADNIEIYRAVKYE